VSAVVLRFEEHHLLELVVAAVARDPDVPRSRLWLFFDDTEEVAGSIQCGPTPFSKSCLAPGALVGASDLRFCLLTAGQNAPIVVYVFPSSLEPGVVDLSH